MIRCSGARLRRRHSGGLLYRAVYVQNHLRKMAQGPMLIGTWADAVWAIHFYEKHGFRLVRQEQKERLLRRYRRVPERRVQASAVLADPTWQESANEDAPLEG